MFFGNMFGGGGMPMMFGGGSPFGGFGGNYGGFSGYGGLGGFGGFGRYSPQPQQFGGFLNNYYQAPTQQMAYGNLLQSLMQPVTPPPQPQGPTQQQLVQDRANLMNQFSNSSRGMGRPIPAQSLGQSSLQSMRQPTSREEMFKMAETNPEYAKNMDLNQMFGADKAQQIRQNLGISEQENGWQNPSPVRLGVGGATPPHLRTGVAQLGGRPQPPRSGFISQIMPSFMFG